MHTMISLACFALLLALPVSIAAQITTVPYIGCPTGGQLGPLHAAKGKPKMVRLPANATEQLAWYEFNGKSGQFGMLGPRGWNCFAMLGSNGINLFIAPEPLGITKILDEKNWRGFTGQVVQMSISEGGTSGRFKAARVIARVFPAHRSFVRSVIAEGIEPASHFPLGPYPSDVLRYKSKELVEFTTPANRKGLGTDSWLLPSELPVRGFAQLSLEGDMDITQVCVRLPARMDWLSPLLVSQAEKK